MQTGENIKKSTVAIVQCESYDEPVVETAVAKGIGLLGGPQAFFFEGERIVLKPNVLVGVHPDQAATTHPAVMGAVMKELKSFGCNLTYGDAPGFGNPAHAMKVSGIAQVAQKYAVPLADFEHSEKVTHPAGQMRRSFPLVTGVLEADGLVSIGKFKTHGLVRFTGAVKNQFGCIPGLQKTQYHAKIPIVHDFCRFIVDINTYVKPRLYIIDAIIAMEGNGPNSGDPKKLGLLLFSADPVACDATACRIIALNPEHVPTCRAGLRSGLGVYHEHDITIVGDPIESVRDKSFRVVRKPAVSLDGTGMVAVIKSYLFPKPVIDKARCTKCGRCIEICPIDPKALSWPQKHEEGSTPPVCDYRKCIRCFCCQETCPSKAIYIKKTLLGILLPLVSVGVIVRSGIRFVIKQVKRKINLDYL